MPRAEKPLHPYDDVVNGLRWRLKLGVSVETLWGDYRPVVSGEMFWLCVLAARRLNKLRGVDRA